MSNSNLQLSLLFFLLSLSSLHSLTLPSDIAALKSFISAVKPDTIPPTSCLGSWNFKSDPCASPRVTHFICGLTCNSSSIPFRVIQITLDPAGYSGTLSQTISNLSNLAVLDLADNNFSGQIPPSLSSLSNLQQLILRSNSFSGGIPPEIRNLKSLETLDLSHNSLSGYLPNINSLSNLKTIDLSYNQLTGSIPKLPTNIIGFTMKANKLSEPLSKSSFADSTQLEVVELSENSIPGNLQAWFFLIPSLQQVNLANNSLKGIEIWKPVNGISDLVAVDLSFNGIKTNLPANFSSYPSLASLSLRYNRFRGPIPWEFGKLKRLFLDGNFLNGRPPKTLFTGESPAYGSLGDNCLMNCPVSSELCLKSQKPTSICREAYGGKQKS
ncbi:LRR receptor-like serine/threonine-protein kinase GHR1 [Impatiens glandulifera]|uniref:LRR receptor-like serine/threonine-protein kinase GHR1 n=1 Tax=Impatiens glandulifera TaxID=253017 RepID=UPI001FB186A9|nr:LRR receptor-like serine/threonine-protein kinase GHR1 [Impatiens glandulifera]